MDGRDNAVKSVALSFRWERDARRRPGDSVVRVRR